MDDREIFERLARAERRIAELGSISGFDASRVLVGLGIGIQAGANITITKSGSLLDIASAGGAAPGAAVGDAFVTIGHPADMTAERNLAAGAHITITDGGANNDVTIAATETELLGIYGDGSDGNVTIGAGTLLTRDMYYDTLTVNAQLKPNGWKIFCKTACIIGAGGSIDVSGLVGALRIGGSSLAATAQSVGSGKAAGTAGAGGTGVGGNGLGQTASTGMGGSSGAGGAGGAGSAGAGGTGGAAACTQVPPRHLTDTPVYWAAAVQSLCYGGAVGNGGGAGGGDGANNGGDGGGSGGSGGIIWLAAKTITNAGSLLANGGPGVAGANAVAGNCGGGGGGGGGGAGGMYLIYDSITVGTISAAGGAGAAGGAKTGTGVAGSAGTAGSAGIILKYNRSTGAFE